MVPRWSCAESSPPVASGMNAINTKRRYVNYLRPFLNSWVAKGEGCKDFRRAVRILGGALVKGGEIYSWVSCDVINFSGGQL